MFLLVNTFYRVPGETPGKIVSRHRSAKNAFQRKQAEHRKSIDDQHIMSWWFEVIDLEGHPCPRGHWAPRIGRVLCEWETAE